jgi:hypothetical protein
MAEPGAGPGAGPEPGVFADDDGSVPAEVAEVLARRAASTAGLREVVAVLAGHRLLVPLVEVDADLLEGDDADPCAGQDRAVAAVSMRTEDGAIGLAFTSMEQLIAWRPDARPMPVAARRVAEALVAEQAVALVIDPAGPAPVRLPPLALARLAGGADWPDPWVDPAVRQAVGAELAPVLSAGEVQVRLAAPDEAAARGAGPGTGSGDAGRVGLLVEVRFPAGLPDEVAQARAAVVADRLSGSQLLREAFDGILAVRVV